MDVPKISAIANEYKIRFIIFNLAFVRVGTALKLTTSLSRPDPKKRYKQVTSCNWFTNSGDI
jgi:hypothetical protein